MSGRSIRPVAALRDTLPSPSEIHAERPRRSRPGAVVPPSGQRLGQDAMAYALARQRSPVEPATP